MSPSASYATVLFVMGMADRLAISLDPKNDPVGLQLEEENLPKRIRTAPQRKSQKENDGPGDAGLRGSERRAPPGGALVGSRPQE